MIVILRPPSYTKTCNYQAVMSVIMLPVYLAVLPAAVYKVCSEAVALAGKKSPRDEVGVGRFASPVNHQNVVTPAARGCGGLPGLTPPSECVMATIYIGHLYIHCY